MDYGQLIEEYKVCKQNYEFWKEEVRKGEEEFKQKYAKVIEKYNSYKNLLEEAESSLRSQIKLDAEFGKEVFPEGLGVRKMTTYNYDSKQAFEWAKQSGLCLSLDTKAFKDICKSDNNRPEFVEVGFEYSPTISKNL